MSSLHQDRLLVEGPETADAAGSPLVTARGTSRRPAGEKASNQVPTQRQGKAQRSGTTTTTVDGAAVAPRPKRSTGSKAAAAATGAAGTIAARAKAAKSVTTRAASSKAATATKATVRAATVKAGAATSKAASKAATAARTAAAAKVAARTSAAKGRTATPAPKPTTTRSAATKPVSAKTAAAKAAPAKTAAAKAAPAKAAAAKTAAAKAAPAKPAAAKTAAAKATPAKAAPAPKRATATTTGRHAALEPTAPEVIAERVPAQRGTAVAVRSTAPTDGRRPTPYKRPRVQETPVVAAVEPEVVAEAAEVVSSVADGRVAQLLRFRLPTVRRRPALYLAAALVGSLGVSALSTTGPSAQATDTMSSISVAQELGIDSTAKGVVIDHADTQRLVEVAASRKERGAEQAAAAQVQAQADQAAAAAAAEAARPKAVLPVNGARLTSGFGPRWGTLHAGTDFAAPIGTPEYSVMDGVVLKAGPASGFGLAVYIQHENGDVTVYGHMEKILVHEGQVVKAGDTIALLGNRGQSTGPHLHLEVHVGGLNGKKIDPLPWLRARGVQV